MTFVPAVDKTEALGRLSSLLDVEVGLGAGSSVPSPVFTAATELFEVPDEGAMPARGRRVVEAGGLVWGPECDSTSTPSGGGATVTLEGLNRLLEAVERRSGTSSAGSEVDPDGFGVPFRHVQGGIASPPTEMLRDWDALDEATREHQDLVLMLAEHVGEHGLEPRLPGRGEPQYDVGWTFGGQHVIAEVKSSNISNRRQQARLGLGQVLEYRARMELVGDGDVACVLLLGEPVDDIVRRMALGANVVPVDPSSLSELERHGLL